jgi:steroid C-25 hydroxylase beta subunit
MSDRQLGQVIDLNKCIGCQTCTVACKRLWTDDEATAHHWWNIVNTAPGEGTPRGWESMGGGYPHGELTLGALPSEQQFGEAWDFDFKGARAAAAGGPHLSPLGGKPSWGPNWDEDRGGGTYPNAWYFYLPRLCNHCARPACVEACPVKAIGKQDDGLVVLDEDKCLGNQLCAMACPYKRIYFSAPNKQSRKCIGCFPRIERGVAPACVRQCPGRVRHFGWLDDPDSQVHQLVHVWKVALPLHPEFGTDPQVFYVPPMGAAALDEAGVPDPGRDRIPREYLRSLFGDSVDAALELLRGERARRMGGEPSELMDLLISRRWSDMLGGFDRGPV